MPLATLPSGTSIVIDAVYTLGLVGVTLTNWAAVYTPTQELSLANNEAFATTLILDPLVDTDGDGAPDFQDTDSDNDYLADRFESENGADRTLADTDMDDVIDSVEVAGNHFHPWGMAEENRDILVCRGLKMPLAELWPRLKHWN